jgi:hypothetical protein
MTTVDRQELEQDAARWADAARQHIAELEKAIADLDMPVIDTPPESLVEIDYLIASISIDRRELSKLNVLLKKPMECAELAEFDRMNARAYDVYYGLRGSGYPTSADLRLLLRRHLIIQMSEKASTRK